MNLTLHLIFYSWEQIKYPHCKEILKSFYKFFEVITRYKTILRTKFYSNVNSEQMWLLRPNVTAHLPIFNLEARTLIFEK